MSDVVERDAQRPPILPLFVYAVAGGAFALPLARGTTIAATSIGAAIGTFVGVRLAASRLRTPWLFGIGALGALLGRALDALVTSFDAVPGLLGADRALALGDALSFGVGALSAVAALRALAMRRRAFAILEVAAVGLAAASLVAGHRNGAINRPFELADPILASGGDPTVLFLAIGGIAASLVALLLMREKSLARGLLHVAFALALLLLLLTTTKRRGLPTPPPPASGVGLRDDDQSSRERRRGRSHGQPRDDSPEFEDDSRPEGGPVPVAVVVFHDDYVPPSGTYYFRQGAFSHYNGRKLVASFGEGVDADVAANFGSSSFDVVGAPPASGARLEVSTSVALLADHTRPFGLESPVRFVPTTNPDPSRFRRTYSVTSRSLVADVVELLGYPPGAPSWSEDAWAEYTERPSDPRFAELAHRIVDETLPEEMREEPVARVAAIVQWLGHEGTYSLRSHHASAPDPTADFLFGDRVGYCVHFAHAGVYLMRSLGIPARVATGYMVDAAARQGGSALVLTDAMAHEWPEVYFEGYGWIVADISPERSLDPPPESVDRDLQRLLGELARGEQPLPEDTPGLVRPDLARWARKLLAALRTTATFGLPALLLLLYVAKIYRRLAPRFAARRSLPRVAYRADLDRLAELGFRRERGESREAFAARLADRLPSFVEVTRLHVGATYGSASATNAVGRFPEASRSLGAELARTSPPPRRLLALLDPFSFLLSR